MRESAYWFESVSKIFLCPALPLFRSILTSIASAVGEILVRPTGEPGAMSGLAGLNGSFGGVAPAFSTESAS
jgi:hypothetical protein